MLVRMLINITGSRDGSPWPAPGGTLDVPDHEAESLIANGYAEAERADAPATEEVASAPDPDPEPTTTDSDGDPAPEVSDSTVKAEPVRRGRPRKAAAK